MVAVHFERGTAEEVAGDTGNATGVATSVVSDETVGVGAVRGVKVVELADEVTVGC